MFGTHRARCATAWLPGGVVPLHVGLCQEHHDVVREDHGDADDETGELAVACDRQAEGQADDGKHEAGRWNRELLLDVHDLGMGRNAVLDLRGDVLPKLLNRLLRQPPGQFRPPEYGIRIQGTSRQPVSCSG